MFRFYRNRTAIVSLVGHNAEKSPQKRTLRNVSVRNHTFSAIYIKDIGEFKLYKLTRKFKAALTAALFATFLSMNTSAACDESKKNEFALFNPAKGVWYTHSADGCAFTAVKWGLATDKLVPGDYDGDGELDAAVYRPESGTWYIRRSSDAKAEILTLQGNKLSGDVPVAADYDGDRIADIAVWRAATGEWIVRNSSKVKDQITVTLGVAGDIPVAADYDGDRKADHAVFRPSENRWIIQQSSDNRMRMEVFGTAGKDTLVPADYTGDGKADIAVYSAGKWTVISSETGEKESFEFGFKDDIAAPADYDCDGTVDFAVYRKGTWYIHESGKPKFRTFDFGGESDIPLAAAATRKS